MTYRLKTIFKGKEPEEFVGTREEINQKLLNLDFDEVLTYTIKVENSD